MTAKTTHEFKAEIKQVLEIITHSLYANKEIFLRELVSNASDACDKLRFLQSSGEIVTAPEAPLEIRVTAAPGEKKLIVTDSGLGMTHDEMVENIGTIARSGSGEFLRRVAETSGSGGDGTSKPDVLSNVIGRFGVGFYSVFMVAEKVVVTSRSWQPGVAAVEWTSDGTGSYELRDLTEEETAALPRGSRIEIFLKDEEKEYAERWRVEEIVKRHSSFIAFPIFLDDKELNTVPALWREPKFNVTKERYKEFYEFLTHDSEEPLETVHVSVDAPVQFNCLAFIPAKHDDMLDLRRDDWGLDLYVRRVLIKRLYRDLLPEYLSFVRGVVDTEDLPLNVSRETLQENRVLRKIHVEVVKHVLNGLKKMADGDSEKYLAFWREHGKVFKLGYNDFARRETFMELLRFNSSTHADKDGLASLAEYVARAKPGQKAIYYLSGPGREAVELSPHVEQFKKKGIEVLYLFEPIDEFMLQTLGKFQDFDFTPAEHVKSDALTSFEDVATDEADKAPELSTDDESVLNRLLARIKDILGEQVVEARASTRLTESPAALVSPDSAATSQMEKIMRVMSKDASIPPKVLEVNRDHKLVRNLIRIFRADEADPFVETAARQLYESALLLEGYLTDPHLMVSRVNKLLEQSSGWYAEVKKL